ncbi:MAG TPA: alpha-amylase family glycosyl hydrolase [Bauldia sp.]|nr:alpha-amylase family glycosyl hydrolase [Bauldia sp.]
MSKAPGAGAADWWRGGVIYEIYPRSFQDSGNDGVGDLAGITRRLPYLADLGIDAVWLAPFFKSPMKDFGYDVSNYTEVDPLFGTMDDFDRLVGEAHRLGLKVMIDQVLSHTSDQHPWFKESRSNRNNPKSDWYVWADPKPDGTPPNNWLSIFGGPAWQWDTRRLQYYLHNFLVEQPDLNFHNPAVQDALLEACRFWLDRGVDGFRLDTINFYFHSRGLESNPPATSHDSPEAPSVNPYSYQEHIHDKSQPENLAFLQRLRALLDSYPARTSVGEIGDGPRSLKTMAAYTSGGDKVHMCYTFDFLGNTFSAAHFRERIAAFESIVGDGWPCWAFSNHDVVRHVSRWAGVAGLDPTRLAKLCAGILLSLRGSVCLYQGEELGLTEAELQFSDLVDPYGIQFWPEYKGRDGCRTPMVWESNAPNGGFSEARPWLPVSPDHIAKAVNREAGDAGSVLAHYRRMLAFRRAHPALVKGDIMLLDAPGDVLAFVRTGEGERVLVAFNLGTSEASFDAPSAPAPLTGHGFAGQASGGRVTLPAGEAFFGTLEAGGTP